MTVRVALAGCGNWGKNLLRVLGESPRATLVAVADPSARARERAKQIAPCARVVPSLDDALASGIDAVVVATPAATHAALALRALDAGADVLVEKPLALSAADADRCAARAAELGRIAMVGHLMRYHPAMVELVERVRRLELGPLVRVASSRLSAAPSSDRSLPPLWNLGPHDLSMLFALDASPVASIEARGTPGGVTLAARLEDGVAATMALSQTSPHKERRLRVVGASCEATFDDVAAPDRLLFAEPGHPAREAKVAWREPLAVEIDHFLRCVEERSLPLTSFDEGARVTRALELAEVRLQGPSLRP